MKKQTELGYIEIAPDVFTAISGRAATNCYGVRGMVSKSVSDDIVYLLRKDCLSKGVKVTFLPEDTVNIELRIAVEHGVNIPAVCESIITEVKYIVEKKTGVSVSKVDVHVDSILAGQ